MTTPLFDALQAALGTQYKLQRELGRGGMATVYLATDAKHGRQVALKVLHPDLAASLGAEGFRREIGFAATLAHPHILTVLDSGETPDGQLWFTMPYVEGETLREHLRRDKQLPIDEALRITRGSCWRISATRRMRFGRGSGASRSYLSNRIPRSAISSIR